MCWTWPITMAVIPAPLRSRTSFRVHSKVRKASWITGAWTVFTGAAVNPPAAHSSVSSPL